MMVALNQKSKDHQNGFNSTSGEHELMLQIPWQSSSRHFSLEQRDGQNTFYLHYLNITLKRQREKYSIHINGLGCKSFSVCMLALWFQLPSSHSGTVNEQQRVVSAAHSLTSSGSAVLAIWSLLTGGFFSCWQRSQRILNTVCSISFDESDLLEAEIWKHDRNRHFYFFFKITFSPSRRHPGRVQLMRNSGNRITVLACFKTSISNDRLVLMWDKCRLITCPKNKFIFIQEKGNELFESGIFLRTVSRLVKDCSVSPWQAVGDRGVSLLSEFNASLSGDISKSDFMFLGTLWGGKNKDTS